MAIGQHPHTYSLKGRKAPSEIQNQNLNVCPSFWKPFWFWWSSLLMTHCLRACVATSGTGIVWGSVCLYLQILTHAKGNQASHRVNILMRQHVSCDLFIRVKPIEILCESWHCECGKAPGLLTCLGFNHQLLQCSWIFLQNSMWPVKQNAKEDFDCPVMRPCLIMTF